MAIRRFSPDAHWRDSAREPRLFFIDAKAVFPMLLFLMHIRWWTFIVATMVVLFFTTLNRFGFSMVVFLRWLRSVLAGRRKMAVPWWE